MPKNYLSYQDAFSMAGAMVGGEMIAADAHGGAFMSSYRTGGRAQGGKALPLP
jgi:hypothetical protein